MGEKVVLPNFDLPRDGTRVAMRLLWGMGGVVVLATLILGVAMWHHRSLEVATQQEAAAKAEAARRAAMAPPPAPKVVEKPAPMGGSATTLANVTGSSAGSSAGTSAASSSTAPTATDAERPAPRAHRHSAKAGHHGKGGAALLERIEGKGAKPASKPAKAPGGHAKSDDDFLDSLLKK